MYAISDYLLFSEVAMAGSFIGASRRLNLTASGVSKRISRFEKKLGVRLFNRTTRTLALTEAGRELYVRSRAISEAISEAEDYAKDFSMVPRGHLRVACSDAFAVQVVVPMLPAFAQQYPDVRISIIHGDGYVDLLGEHVDVAIRFERPTQGSYVAKRLVHDPWVLCATPEYLREHGQPANPSDLLEHSCLTILTSSETSDTWVLAVNGRVESVKVNSTFSGIGHVVKAAVMRNLGIARLANFLVSQELATGTLVPVLPEYMPDDERSIYAVYPNREYLPLKVRVFLDALPTAVTSGVRF